MRLLIDIGHPGDFYLFKHIALELEKKNHKVLFTVRQGEHETKHIFHSGLKYKLIGRKKKSLPGKIFGIFEFTLRIIIISLKFKPTHFISHGSLFAGLASFFLFKPHIALEDTGNMEQIKLSKPFSDIILSSDVLYEDLGKKQLRYKGYHELCYLTPKYFTPNKKIYEFLEIPEGTKYAIIRFISWKATHDFGHTGISNSEKIELVNLLSEKMKVFISVEGKIIPELEKFKIKIPVYMMHDALAYASLYVGEGTTMAAEAGVLGTPSVFINTRDVSYTKDQEKYGTVFNFNYYSQAKDKINEIINIADKNKFIVGKNNILSDKIDVTAFMVWFLENYPQSIGIMRDKPDFQFNFRNV